MKVLEFNQLKYFFFVRGSSLLRGLTQSRGHTELVPLGYAYSVLFAWIRGTLQKFLACLGTFSSVAARKQGPGARNLRALRLPSESENPSERV